MQATIAKSHPGVLLCPPYVRGRDGKWYPCNRKRGSWAASDDRPAIEDRIQVAVELHDRGLSLRAIADLIDVSHETVRRYLSRSSIGARDTCVGLDGKTYTASREATP